MENPLLINLKKFMVNNFFSDELAFRISRCSSYNKGKKYFEDGCVEKIWQEGNKYKAIVKGTHPYNLSLKFNDEGELEYNCNCSYELDGACKHVVAAIFAFASDKKIINKASLNKNNKDELVIEKLLEKTTFYQAQLFLKKIFIKQPQLIQDFNIFLQGQKQSPVTITNYKTRFRNELDQIDLKELLQTWYSEDEDYYADDQYNDFNTTLPLSDVVDDLVELGKKYEDSQNLGEALKIYQALFEALDEKQASLKGDDSELQDCFYQEMEKIVSDYYVKTLTKIKNDNLKKIGVDYLCYLFQYDEFRSSQNNILLGLKQVNINKSEAENALLKLDKTKNKDNLSVSESSLLALLYFLIKDWQMFEKVSFNNLKKNPSLTLDLLRYYQKNNYKEKIIKVSNQVLVEFMKKNEDRRLVFKWNQRDYKEIEIQIRRFLKEIYSLKTEYEVTISNLERLFLITGLLTDYQELIKNYKNTLEKERFWEVMSRYFTDKHEIKNIFEVFKLENQKEKILDLVRKHPLEECFSDMIAFVRDDFPQECFTEYEKKIIEILKETDVDKYPESAYHLKRMKEVGLDKEFTNFISWIKTNYWRRRRLLQELQENQL